MTATRPTPHRDRAPVPRWTAVAAIAGAFLLASCTDEAASSGSTAPVATTAPPPATTAPPASAPTTPPAPASTAPQPDPATAADHCTAEGGTVETRRPYLDTNLDRADWVPLPGSLELCRFESDDADASRLYIDTMSLAATSPSLADAAYLAKLPLPTTTGGANPAAVNCVDTVHGASSFGTSANGGGWVDLDDPVFTVVDLCVFADGSAIDQWAIAYYAGGITRGADLAPMFRFDAAAAGDIFPPAPAG